MQVRDKGANFILPNQTLPYLRYWDKRGVALNPLIMLLPDPALIEITLY